MSNIPLHPLVTRHHLTSQTSLRDVRDVQVMLEDLSVKRRQGCLGCYDLSVCLQIEDLYGIFGMLYIFEKNVTPPRQNKKVYLSNRRFVIKMSRFDTHISSHPRFCIHFIQILTSLYKTSPYIIQIEDLLVGMYR